MSKEQSCEDRISAELADREETARRILAASAGEPDDEYDEESLFEWGLGIDKKIVYRFELSTGGPADYLTITVDPSDREVESVEYHFADWFDHASRPVEQGSSLWSVAEYVAESMACGEQ